jgi:hypothetical protein
VVCGTEVVTCRVLRFTAGKVSGDHRIPVISGRSAVETPTALVLTLRDGGLPEVTGAGVRAYEPDRRRAAFWAARYIREDQVPSAFRTDIREIPVADQGSGPYHITTGPDRALWLTLIHSGQVARLAPGGDLDF